MNKHLTLIKIKNSDFDYAKYGLKNPYFSIDITASLSYSRNVGVTQYAVLDGTTRLDNISREPATLTLQGLLGELRAGNTPEHFAYNTLEKNRLQHQMDLIEALRDQAVFLDFVTDERTYKNYLITGCSFGKNNFGKIDVNISAREAITFGDEINIQDNPTSSTSSTSAFEQNLILDSFVMNDINSDSALIEEIYRVITSSVLSTPFIITLGPVDINPDVIMPSYSILKQPTSNILPKIVGQSIIVTDTNLIYSKVQGTELYTGTVYGGNYLHITTPLLAPGTNLYKQRITRNDNGTYSYANLATTYIHIRLKNGQNDLYSVQKGEVLKTPFYSDIVNGIHSLNTSGSNEDIISSYKFGLSFVRKQKNNQYTLVPNLLGTDNKGFLYSATYEVTEGNISIIYPVLVYIQPYAWTKIKSELNRVWANSSYFKTKVLTAGDDSFNPALESNN